MRILFVIKSLAAKGGGAERIITAVSKALADRGHEVSLVTFDNTTDCVDFYEVGPNVTRYRLGPLATVSFTTLRGLSRVRRLTRELQPDAVVAFMHSSFIPVAIALAGTGIPVVGSERTSYQHYEARPFQRALLNLSAPLLRRLTINGDGIRKKFPRKLAAKMTVIPNPVTTANEAADPIGGEVKTLLSVGRLRPEKDHRTLISAFARVAEQFPQWRLSIVGDGELSGSLRDQVKAEGVVERVEMLGATKLVEREYVRAQLFAIPSLYESFPNCLAEALAHGLPAIGFQDCPGVNEMIVDGENGILVSNEDRITSLSRGLSELMGNPERRQKMGLNALATLTKHNISDILPMWEDLLERARFNSYAENDAI